MGAVAPFTHSNYSQPHAESLWTTEMDATLRLCVFEPAVHCRNGNTATETSNATLKTEVHAVRPLKAPAHYMSPLYDRVKDQTSLGGPQSFVLELPPLRMKCAHPRAQIRAAAKAQQADRCVFFRASQGPLCFNPLCFTCPAGALLCATRCNDTLARSDPVGSPLLEAMRPRGGVFLAGVLAALSQVFLLADCRVLLPISLAGRATSLVELRTAAASAQRDQGSNAAAAPGGASAKDEDEDTSDSAAEESHAEGQSASAQSETQENDTEDTSAASASAPAAQTSSEGSSAEAAPDKHSASKDQQSESEAASEKYSQSSEAAESRTSQSASQSAADASGSQASQNSATPSAMAKDEEDRKAEKKVDSGEAADAVHGTEHSQAAPAEEAAQAAAAPSLERFAHPEQSSTREQSVALHEHAESAAPQEAAAEHPSALRVEEITAHCVLMHNKIRTARLDQWPDSLIADDTLSEAARSRAKAFIANNCKNPDGTELDSRFTQLQELMMPKTGTACDALNYVFLDGLSDLERVVKEDSPGTYTPGDSASPWHSENAQKFALMLSETGKAVGCAATVGCTADVVFCMYSPALSVGGTPVSSHYFKALKKRSKVEAHGEEFLPGGVAEHEVKSVAGARIAPSESSATVSYYTAAVPAVVSLPLALFRPQSSKFSSNKGSAASAERERAEQRRPPQQAGRAHLLRLEASAALLGTPE
ncbi:uncharacterized protein LOC34618164 [Cyclospora cayetanensis]|uniref:Uncharacterized protein LOC34618164 n=1 Tax=Cyclospora cayetanensis TaxID=88456 RepID=A0A6P6RQZ8_9EIME|nr:uncharacterized protein LOC34618164 [Cyclospora cayetanensis]